jgi:hypothetical protein
MYINIHTYIYMYTWIYNIYEYIYMCIWVYVNHLLSQCKRDWIEGKGGVIEYIVVLGHHKIMKKGKTCGMYVFRYIYIYIYIYIYVCMYVRIYVCIAGKGGC